MRVVVFGASGNVGTSLVHQLRDETAVDEVVGVARRPPAAGHLGVDWRKADISSDDLEPLVRGADAVVHLAWVLHPTRDEPAMHAVNVVGSRRIFEAVGRSGVRSLVYASSVGAYSPGPKNRLVDEGYPTDGVVSSVYSRQKAYVERLLDTFEAEHSSTRVVRMRPALIFKPGAAGEIRRLFIGRLLPPLLVPRGRLPVVPRISRLVFQTVHTLDAADAYRRAVLGTARGAFNVAADPVLDPKTLAEAFRAVQVPLPSPVARLAAEATFRLHLQPTEPGWLDLAFESPIMDTHRARTELDWTPRFSSLDAIRQLLDGMHRDEALGTAQLQEPAGAR